MRRRNLAGTYMHGLAAQRGVTRFACTRLQITAGRELEVRNAERYFVSFRKSSSYPQFVERRGPKAVIYPVCGEDESEFATKQHEDV